MIVLDRVDLVVGPGSRLQLRLTRLDHLEDESRATSPAARTSCFGAHNR
jgi:hypothetical protein